MYDRLRRQRQIAKIARSNLKHIISVTLLFLHRIGALGLRASIALLLWCTALFASISAESDDPDSLSPSHSAVGLALCGRLGPSALAPSWLANVLLAISRCLEVAGQEDR